MAAKSAPDIVVGRIPLYLRILNRLIEAEHTTTNSQEMGAMLGISSAQIRKDLSYFGGFGKYGAGYDVLFLRDQLQRILNLEYTWPVVLIGAGDLGRAVANYHGFAQGGFEITGVFDNDPAKIGQPIGNLVVQDVGLLEQTIRLGRIKIAIIAVPTPAAQAVTDRLVNAGVAAILSYAPTTLRVPDHVKVQYIDPVAELQHMAYYLKKG